MVLKYVQMLDGLSTGYGISFLKELIRLTNHKLNSLLLVSFPEIFRVLGVNSPKYCILYVISSRDHFIELDPVMILSLY
jgi:hypothetical protein